MLPTVQDEFLAGEATANLVIQLPPEDMDEIVDILGEWLYRPETLDDRRISAVSCYSKRHT